MKFKFKPTKRCRFEKISSPLILEFYLVFFTYFSWFFIFLNLWTVNPVIFESGVDRIRRISIKCTEFINPGQGLSRVRARRACVALENQNDQQNIQHEQTNESHIREIEVSCKSVVTRLTIINI
jgi:hypothetical protein